MNQKQNDHLTMLENLNALLILKAAVIAGIVDLVTAAAILANYVKDLRTNRDIQNVDVKGIAGNKQKLIEGIIEKTLALSGPLVNLGTFNNDDEMVQEFDFSQSFLERLRDNDLASIASDTADAANTNVLALAGSGVTITMINDLNTDLTTLSVVNTAPEKAIEQKAVASENILDLIPKTRLLIKNSLKPLMRTNFRTADPDFYKEFLKSTKIISTGVRHLSIFGKVISSLDGTPVNAAAIKVFLGTKVVAQVKSGPKGNFRVKNLEDGSYTIEITRLGYTSQTISGIIVIVGKGTKVNFTIVPL